MKILITSDVPPQFVCGIVTSYMNLYHKLKERGHDVRILSLSPSFRTVVDGDTCLVRSLPLYVYPGARVSVFSHDKAINDIIEWKPDIIHSQSEFSSYMFACRISSRTGAPIVHTFHTMYDYYSRYVTRSRFFSDIILPFYLKWRLKSSRCIIAPSHKAKCVVNGYGIYGDIRVIPTGIDLARYRANVPQRKIERMRDGMAIPPNDTVLLVLGRLGHEKMVEGILRMFKALIMERPDTTLLIVGEGPARAGLEELSGKLGISGKVVFTGMVSPEDARLYYRLGDIYVSSSVSEMQSLTFIEALASGLPMVCRSDEYARDVVTDGINGFIYVDETSFIESVSTIMSDGSGRLSMAAESRRISDRYGLDAFADSVEILYTELVGRKYG